MHLTLYSRPGCHLCDEMKAVIERGARSASFGLEVVDISGDARLEARFGQEVPVLFVDGRKAAKYRLTDEQLARLLRADRAT